MTDPEWEELVTKAVLTAVGTGLFSWFKQRHPRIQKKNQPDSSADHGERIDRLEEEVREIKDSQKDMHRENQDRMRELAGELRESRKISIDILSRMANISR